MVCYRGKTGTFMMVCTICTPRLIPETRCFFELPNGMCTTVALLVYKSDVPVVCFCTIFDSTRPTSAYDCSFRNCNLNMLRSSNVANQLQVTTGEANITILSRGIGRGCKCETNFTKCYNAGSIQGADLYYVSILAKVYFAGACSRLWC